MKTLVFTILILFAAVAITLLALENPGYVLITRAPWSVEMPLTLFIPLVIIAAGVFYLFLRLISRIWSIPRDVAGWKQERHTRRARTALNQALISLAEGNWVKAEAQLLAGLHHSEMPVLHYLAAAFASQGQNHTEKRDEYLSQAQKSSPGNALAISMTQAQLQYLAQQYEQALATLSSLRKQQPDNTHVLKLLMNVYLDLRDWTSLAELFPDLRRHNVLNPAELSALELRTHRELLMLSLPTGSRAVLKKAWNAVPHVLRSHPDLITLYVRHLINQNDMDEAEKMLRQALNREWNDALVNLYGKVTASNAEEQLETAEGWLHAQPQNPALLLALGRIAGHNGQWNKARDYLEKSVGIRPTAENCHELGRLLEQMGETDKALTYYRRACEIDRETTGTPVVAQMNAVKHTAAR